MLFPLCLASWTDLAGSVSHCWAESYTQRLPLLGEWPGFLLQSCLSLLGHGCLDAVFLTFPVAVTKPNKSNVKKRVILRHSSKLHPIAAEKSWQEKLRQFLTWHPHSEAERGECAPSSPPFFPFEFSPQPQPTEWRRPHLKQVSPAQLTSNLETGSQSCPDDCFHGNSKSHQVDSQDELSQMPS